MCVAMRTDGSPATATNYHWTAEECYNITGGVIDPCFYGGSKTGQNITGNDLLAQDAGTVTCSATIDGVNYTSDPLTLCISGELGIYIVYYFYISYCYINAIQYVGVHCSTT